MKLFKRLDRKSRKTTEEENDRAATVQADLFHVTNLSVNAKFYEQQVGEGQIRILTVLPGSHPDPISCIMRDIDTRDAPRYDAISYCWTHRTKVVPITVNGSDDFKIPAPLRACLRRVRQKGSATHVWVDAICINQADELEKSEQVRQMPKIYGSCWQTLIWLGDTEPDVPSCLVRDDGYCATGGFSSIEHGSMLQLLGDFLQIAEDASLRPDPEYLQRVWWKRLWCVQEFMLSPRAPKVMIGPHLVRWGDFLASSQTIVNPIFKGPWGGSNDWQAQNHRRSLLELLRITSTNFACTDPRDRIFALLGITNDTKLSIQADYNKTPEEVYSEATMYLIETENNIDMLLDQRVSRSNSSLPTWVPDFMNLKNSTAAGTPDGFRASSEKPVTAISYRPPSISCGCTGSCLTLRAIRFDKIARRMAIEAVCSRRPANQIYAAGPTHHFREAPDGRNHDTLSGPRHTCRVILPTRQLVSSHQRKLSPRMASWLDQMDQDASFLDWVLESLAIDSSRASALNLDSLPQVGLLFLDYLFNGSQSLEQAVIYHRQGFTQDDRNRKAVQRLMQRHGLNTRQAVLHDLQIALEVQSDVLDKISKTTTMSNVMSKALKMIKYGRESEHDLMPLSHLLDTYPGRDSLETVILKDWEIDPVALTVEVREAGAGVQKSTSGYERVFFKTDDQHLGVGPGDMQEGDEVVVPFGSSRPWVLRSHGDHHVFVGDAFIPGIMTGQLEELWRRGELNYTDYVVR